MLTPFFNVVLEAPEPVTDLLAWYDFSQEPAGDSSVLTDRSGNNRHAYAYGAPLSPVNVTPGQGGHNVGAFDSGQHFRADIPFTPETTVIMACRWSALSGGTSYPRYFTAYQGTASSPTGIDYGTPGLFNVSRDNSSLNPQFDTAVYAFAIAVTDLTNIVLSLSLSAAGLTGIVNGDDVHTYDIGTPPTSPSVTATVFMVGDPNGHLGNVNMFEMRVYSRALTTVEIAAVDAEIRTKWAY